ncbi:MAG: tetratricopeptide repeat protein [Anaerolineae bacterium]
MQLDKLKAYLPPHLGSRLSPTIDVDDALTILIHITSLRYTLSTYLPRYLVKLIVEDPTPGQVTGSFRRGTVMFADVSGFTAMSEKLSALGKEGAEEITGIVNDYFDTMLEISDGYGGDLLKFGGDALLLFFEGADGPRRAVATGQAMQGAMSRFAQVETSQGVFPLRMSIGMGSGPIFLASLGSAQNMEYAVMGRTLANMAQAEDRATAGQVMVDRATREAAGDVAAFDPAGDDFWLLNGHLLEEASSAAPNPDFEPPLLVMGDDASDLLNQCQEHITIIEALRPFVADELLSRLIADPQQPALPGSHRPVTVMFANFYGIDEIIEALGQEHEAEITEILNAHFSTMSRILARYEGIVNKVDTYAVGHRIMALFGALRAHEDDPQHAVRAALDMNQALDEVNERTRDILAGIPGLDLDFGPAPLKQRIGLNSGFVFAGNVGSDARREYSVMGDEVNLTARLMGVAQEGQVLISHSTARHVGDEFTLNEGQPVKVKGKTHPVRNFAVTGVRDRPLRWANVVTGRVVGRDQELEIGYAAVERARTGDGCLLAISGPSGIGKTRLAEEIVGYGQSAGMELLVGTCLSYGKTMTYHPWADILRAYFGIQQTDDINVRLESVRRGLERMNLGVWAPIIGEALGLPIPDNDLTGALEAKLRRQRLFDLTLELLQTRAQDQPLMVVVEDAHWADPASMDLITYIARNIAACPILFILPHRPDDDLPAWNSYAHAIHLPLGDLSEEASLEIVQGMLGPLELPERLRDLILSKGAGNPFFLEEVVRALIDAGALREEEPGKWQVTREQGTVELPDTIHGIIISRVDRLLEADRRILQVASVIGRVFQQRILSGVYQYGDLEGTIQRRLDYLGQLGLTEIQSIEEELHRFKHLTTQEVVYESQSFGQRRNLHRRIAQFIEREFADRINEQTDLLAYHYFEGQVWAKAMEFNLRAARRAQREFANDTAVAAYQRTLDVAARVETDATVERLLAHESLGDVLTLSGRYEEALEHYAAARKLVESEPRSIDQLRHLAELCRKTADVYERRSEYDRAFEWLEKGLNFLDEDEPTIEAARIYLLGAGVYQRQGNNEEAIAWCQKSLASASQIKTREGQQTVAQAYYNLGGIYIRRGDLRRAVGFCRQSVQVYQGIDDIVGLSQAYINLANAYSDQGDWEQASQALNRSLKMKQEIGDILHQGFISNNLGNIYLYRGEWDRAAKLFEQSIAIWKQVAAALPEGVTLSNLAQVHIYQAAWPEAERCLSRSQAIFTEIGSEDYLPELERRWGEYYLKTGALDEALVHTRRSIELAVAHEARLEEGVSCRLLGLVHLARGERGPAEIALRKSLKTLNDLNSEYEAARTMLNLVQLAVEDEEPARAGAQLARARRIFEKLGAKADLAEAQKLEQKLPRVA